MKNTPVHLTLDRILIAVAASMGSAACGIPLDGMEKVTCTAGGALPADLAQLSLPEPADYLELRGREGYDDISPFLSVTSAGTACATATDVPACEAALEAATSTVGFNVGECIQICTDYILIVNRGDTVEVIDSVEGIAALIGDIDVADEASLAVALQGYDVGCNDIEAGGVREATDGYEVIATGYTSICSPITRERFLFGVSSDGVVAQLDSEVIETSSACIGRRPAGLCAARPHGRTRLGAWLGDIAHLEAASVHAFAELQAELARHDAPQALRHQAARARKDEIRHARQMARLARRFGGQVASPVVRPQPQRDLEEIARENAVEGCVRETYGALMGQWQARTAADPEIRATMRRIAEDETRHAALSWAIAAWLDTKLDGPARARVSAAQRAALAALRAEVEAPTDPVLVAMAGLPSREAQRALVAGLANEIT